MKLTVLGCEGPFPAPGGGCSSYLVRAGEKKILLDAGSGSLAHLGQCMALTDLDAVVLSHLHFDHMGEIPLLAYALQNTDKKLDIWMPEGPESVRSLIESFPVFVCHTAAAGETVMLGTVEMSFLPARHPVPAVGVRIRHHSRSVVYTGDTNTFPDMASAYAGADVLLIDGGLTAEQWTEEKPHLSAAMAAQVSLDAGARQAILTHFAPEARKRLLNEARDIAPRMLGAAPMRIYEF